MLGLSRSVKIVWKFADQGNSVPVREIHSRRLKTTTMSDQKGLENDLKFGKVSFGNCN